jgi:hypothetical protein
MTTLEMVIWIVILGIVITAIWVCGKAWYEVQWNPDWTKSKWEKFKDEVHYLIFNTYRREDLD